MRRQPGTGHHVLFVFGLQNLVYAPVPLGDLSSPHRTNRIAWLFGPGQGRGQGFFAFQSTFGSKKAADEGSFTSFVADRATLDRGTAGPTSKSDGIISLVCRIFHFFRRPNKSCNQMPSWRDARSFPVRF